MYLQGSVVQYLVLYELDLFHFFDFSFRLGISMPNSSPVYKAAVDVLAKKTGNWSQIYPRKEWGYSRN